MPKSSGRSTSEPVRVQPSKRYRCDTGNAAGGELAPGQGSVLRAFGAWSSVSATGERRATTRHQPVECASSIGWRSWGRRRRVHVLVMDISRGGARVFLDASPPMDRVVRVHLETPDRETVVEAQVLEVYPAPQGQCVARLRFRQPCSYDLFEAAVCGVAPIRRPQPGAGA